jgi:hypothetical protein
VIKTTVARTKDTGVGNFTLFSRFTREPVRCPPGGGPECSARHHSAICAIRNPLRFIKPAAYPDPSLDPASADAGKRPPPASSLIAFHGQVSCRKTWGRYAQDRVPMRSKVPAVNQSRHAIVTTRWAERLASSPRGNPSLRYSSATPGRITCSMKAFRRAGIVPCHSGNTISNNLSIDMD